jgi:hypothetical protein
MALPPFLSVSVQTSWQKRVLAVGGRMRCRLNAMF